MFPGLRKLWHSVGPLREYSCMAENNTLSSVDYYGQPLSDRSILVDEPFVLYWQFAKHAITSH